MRGIPKYLNSKADYEFMCANYPREQWAPYYQALLDTQNDWFFVKQLAKGEIGQSDDTHRVVIDASMNGEESKNYQYELRYNPECKLAKLGYTEDEVKAILAEE